MSVFRHGRRCAGALPAYSWRQSVTAVRRRTFASRIAVPTPSSSLAVPTIETCPSPTCSCRETPAGLDIERAQSLNGTMAAYAEQVLICTGKADWKSRIEEEEDGVLVRALKGLMGPKGKYSDPYHNVAIVNSSFPPSTAHPPPNGPDITTTARQSASAFLLPSFRYLPTIPTDPSGVEALVRAFVKPTHLHLSYQNASSTERTRLQRQPELQALFPDARPVNEILILICGHGGRDSRCGVLGPLLQREFEEKLQRQRIPVLHGAPGSPNAPDMVPDSGKESAAARVGLISHIGGHKWAGNVIVYLPPALRERGHALAGKGIWYGRVEPRHVEGIVSETVLGGRVIRDMFRGGVEQGGEVLRL